MFCKRFLYKWRIEIWILKAFCHLTSQNINNAAYLSELNHARVLNISGSMFRDRARLQVRRPPQNVVRPIQATPLWDSRDLIKGNPLPLLKYPPNRLQYTMRGNAYFAVIPSELFHNTFWHLPLAPIYLKTLLVFNLYNGHLQYFGRF